MRRYVDLALIVLVVAVLGWLMRPRAPVAPPSTSSAKLDWTDLTWPPKDLSLPPLKLSDDLPVGWGNLTLDEVNDCWREGIAKADNDLRQGRARTHQDSIAFFCGTGSQDWLDFETGLPLGTSPRLSGTNVREYMMECVRDAGNDARVTQYVALRGLPRNTRQRWRQQIVFPSLYLPGRTAVSIERPEVGPDGDAVKVFHDSIRIGPVLLGRGRFHEPRAVWGPPGSRTLFVCTVVDFGNGSTEDRVYVYATDTGDLLASGPVLDPAKSR